MLIAGASVVAIALLVGLLATIMLVYQGKRDSKGNPQYVALGSSFAAGIGLGPRAPGSPVACMRSLNGYPQQLARMLGLSLVDRTCSGATTDHILFGGQFFQPPQLDGLNSSTVLVTVTTGGNDVRYVSDLSFLAARNSPTFMGRALGLFWRGPLRAQERNFEKVRADLVAMLKEIHRRSPKARVILISYPMILPPSGVCQALNISEEQAEMMRAVGGRLADVARIAASEGSAIFLDMNATGASHHACSSAPWVNGWNDAQGTRFHPTLLGAQATASAIASALEEP
jgi:lysophospholipase L1-like esterase